MIFRKQKKKALVSVDDETFFERIGRCGHDLLLMNFRARIQALPHGWIHLVISC